jgi:hypothetical protein
VVGRYSEGKCSFLFKGKSKHTVTILVTIDGVWIGNGFIALLQIRDYK